MKSPLTISFHYVPVGPSSLSLEDITGWLQSLRPPKGKGIKKTVGDLSRCMRKLMFFSGWAKEVEEEVLVLWREKASLTIGELSMMEQQDSDR